MNEDSNPDFCGKRLRRRSNILRETGRELGDYFFDTLFSDIDSLALFGGIHRKVYGYHRLLSSRFPYAIYYKIENEKIR